MELLKKKGKIDHSDLAALGLGGDDEGTKGNPMSMIDPTLSPKSNVKPKTADHVTI